MSCSNRKFTSKYFENVYNFYESMDFDRVYTFYDSMARIDAYFENVYNYYESMGCDEEMATQLTAEEYSHFCYSTEEEMMEYELIEKIFADNHDDAINQAKVDSYLVSLLYEDEDCEDLSALEAIAELFKM